MKDVPVEPVSLPSGQLMRCLMCAGELFEARIWKLNTSGMEFMNMGWANRNASCYVCNRCRYIHWFDM